MRTWMLSLLTLTACAGGGSRNETILALTGDATAGADVFSTSCAACHAADGTGGSGPALTDLVGTLSDDVIIDTVLDGSGDMAPVALPDQDMADLLAYLRDTF